MLLALGSHLARAQSAAVTIILFEYNNVQTTEYQLTEYLCHLFLFTFIRDVWQQQALERNT
jgi:hypothetical protein